LTGAAFGSLNASPWFNFSIAALFVVLALALFDVIAIDLSRYQPKGIDALSRDAAARDAAARDGAGRGGASRLLRGSSAAFLMGAVAALLAGACVAPVVISVLIIAGNLYRAGHAVGLVLPFVLGVGMALPWPFAGAGLSVLPKPGKWMTRVKYVFAAFVLLFAVYYAHEGYSLARDRLRDGEAAQVAAAQTRRVDQEGWLTSLPEALRQAKLEGKPLFIDFWAGWCKSCLTMDRTTFQDPAVKKALESFVKLKYRADDPTESPTKEVLERFTVLGLPTYLILRP
jgi:thiol:disulfide interchange protein